MEERHKGRYREGLGLPHSERTTVPTSAQVHQPINSLNPVLEGFYGGCITMAQLIT